MKWKLNKINKAKPTCRKAIPTATPATTSKLVSSHSSPALKQPFSFIILETGSPFYIL